MHQVKIFKGVENDVATLELEVNRWLSKATNVRVLNVFGNIAPQSSSPNVQGLASGGFTASDVLLVVLYEEPG